MSVKSIFKNILCGPTNQILLIPVDLFMVFQKCVEKNDELSRKIKRLLNKYLEAKVSLHFKLCRHDLIRNFMYAYAIIIIFMFFC